MLNQNTSPRKFARLVALKTLGLEQPEITEMSEFAYSKAAIAHEFIKQVKSFANDYPDFGGLKEVIEMFEVIKASDESGCGDYYDPKTYGQLIANRIDLYISDSQE